MLNGILSNTGDISSISTIRDMNNNSTLLLSSYVNLFGAIVTTPIYFYNVNILKPNQVVYKSYADNVLTNINFTGSITVLHDIPNPVAIATSNFVLTSIPSTIINSGYVVLDHINVMAGNVILPDIPIYQQLQASTLKYLNDSMNILERIIMLI